MRQGYFPSLAEGRATAGSVERIYNRHGGASDAGGGAGLVAGFHFQRSAKSIVGGLRPAAIGLRELRRRRSGVFVFHHLSGGSRGLRWAGLGVVIVG